MKKAIKATQAEFESSSGKTPEYLAWHRLFKREFSAFLKSKGASNIEIGKPNHFDMSGFFTLGNTIWYFSISDLRGFKDNMLIRTAKHYKDYTGGMNQYAPLNQGENTFIRIFNEVTERNEEGTLQPMHHYVQKTVDTMGKWK